MSAITELPTTPGSIVIIDDWEDNDKTVLYTHVLTLVPGGYDSKTGEFADVVWMDMYGEEGGSYDVPENVILESNPRLLFEAPEAKVVPAGKFDAEDCRQYGTILLLDNADYGKDTVAVFTPGAMDFDGAIIEGSWVNSYGAWFSQGTVEDEATALLVMGSLEDI